MNFTELCRETARLCDITGHTGLVVADARGEHANVVQWTRNAWTAIQQQHEWTFLRKNLSFVTVAGQDAYLEASIQAEGAPIRDIDRESLRVYSEAIGRADEQFLVEWDWESWYDVYGYGIQVPARPAVFAIRPDDSALVLGAVPDGVYRVVGKYWRQAQELVLGDDVPIIKAELHRAIPYQAMLSYGNREAAAEAKQEAVEQLATAMALMQRLYLPQAMTGGPLA